MDEAEKYQQRLQAIAEKRRVQEGEDRVRRETEEEWLKIAQRKRKSLRDQWLMEPMPSSAEASGTGSTPCPSTQTTEEISTDTPIEMQEEGDKTANMNDEQASQMTENEDSSLLENTEKLTEANHEEEDDIAITNVESGEAVNPEVILQNGQLDRSVLGVLEIQVERDLKTGATTINSMAPVPAAAGSLDTTEAMLDDGKRAVHAVGAAESNQHSERELSQILNAGTEVGMQTILDGVGVTSNEAFGDEKERKEETRDPEVETGDPEVEQSTEDLQETTDPTHNSLQQDKTPENENEQDEVQGSDMDDTKAKVQEEGDEEWDMVNCRPEEGLDPVVLSFLGFTQVQADSGLGYEDQGAVLKVEQVFIGGEEVLEMGPSGNQSPITVENIKSDNLEAQLNTIESNESCSEETPPEGTLHDVVLDTGAAAGTSVALHDMDNISDIMDSEDVSTEAQQTLPHISNDTHDVPEVTKEVPEDSAGSATIYTEEQDRHAARTIYTEEQDRHAARTIYTEEQDRHAARTETEAQRMDEFPKVEIIKHGSNPEDELFEDVLLDVNKETPQTLEQRAIAAQSFKQEPEIQALVSPDVSQSRARGGGEMTKRKTCQCCSVM